MTRRPKEKQFSSDCIKGKWIHYEHPEISHHLMDRAMKESTRQFQKILIFFHISKCLACNAGKNITVEDKKKIMNKLNTAAWSYC